MRAAHDLFARLSRAPRALLTSHGASLGTLCVLDEVHGKPGLLLWQILQDVRLWASVPAADRGSLFADPAAPVEIPGLELLLTTLAAKLRGAEGAEAMVAHACKEIAGWAERAGYACTAVEFAQTAALVAPRDAGAAYLAGRLLRIRADYARAELWFRRAVVLGRSTKDWEAHANALGGLGALFEQTGKLKVSRHFYLRCFRAAREHALPELKGRALHALCILAFDLGTPEEVVALGSQALHTLGRSHPSLPKLANDLAWYWAARRGAHAQALPVFQSLLNHVWEPASRLQVLANIARAAGGGADEATYDEATDEVRAIISLYPRGEGHSQALRDLAHGAVSLRRWREAEALAREAQATAKGRREGQLVIALDDLLAAIAARRETTEADVQPPGREVALAAALTAALA